MKYITIDVKRPTRFLIFISVCVYFVRAKKRKFTECLYYAHSMVSYQIPQLKSFIYFLIHCTLDTLSFIYVYFCESKKSSVTHTKRRLCNCCHHIHGNKWSVKFFNGANCQAQMLKYINCFPIIHAELNSQLNVVHDTVDRVLFYGSTLFSADILSNCKPNLLLLLHLFFTRCMKTSVFVGQRKTSSSSLRK